MRYSSGLLLLGAGLWLATGSSPASESDPIVADLARLRTAILTTDDTGLVNFFRLRVQGEPAREKLNELIKTLKSSTPATRQQAYMELVAIGKPALPLLRTAAHKDSGLAQRCVKTIESDSGDLAIAAARVLAHRRASGLAEVLLAYLPQAENDAVREELKHALNAVVYAKGVAEPAVVTALSDKNPMRRTAAIVALAQGDIAQNQGALRKLLHDPVASVRLHAALALDQVADPEAITTLVALVEDLPVEQAHDAEDFLIELAGELGPQLRLGQDETSRPQVREAWAKWWRDTDGAQLLDELKKRTITDADRDNLQALIQKLGDDSFRVRQKSQKDLIRRGMPVLPLIKQALKDPDPEVQNRARQCVASIESTKEKSSALFRVIVRLVALRKPPGTAEVILAGLPYLNDEELIEEMQYALNAVALADGKSSPAILRALHDKAGMRRAAAVQALCAGAQAERADDVRRLLDDPDSSVRLKAALALAHARDSAAVSTLIALLAELPADQAQVVENYLGQLAGDAKPSDLPEGDASKKKRSATWAQWWELNKNRVDISDPFGPTLRERFHNMLQGGFRGYTLLVQTQSNSIIELDAQGKRRWTLNGLKQPWDAQVLPGQRVLVVERGGRVSERDTRGKILWQKQIFRAISAQRLRNGNTFIASQNQFIEVNRAGKEVQKIPMNRPGRRVGVRGVRMARGGGPVRAARKLPNGNIAFYDGNCIVQLNKKGQEIKRAPINAGGGGCNEILDNGHALISSPGNGNLIEFDVDGKEIHRFQMQGVVHGFRLPNGHTLATINRGKYVELDKNWKPIKETTLTAQAFRVKRR